MEDDHNFISDRQPFDRRLFDRRVLGSQAYAGLMNTEDRRLHARRSGKDRRSQHVDFGQILAEACAACRQTECQCRAEEAKAERGVTLSIGQR